MNLKQIHNVYFIGIGGIGMSAIARYFRIAGKTVGGYDRSSSEITRSLTEIGIDINYSEAISNIPKTFQQKEGTLIVFTPAVPESHLQLRYFKENKYKIVKRSKVLAWITENTFCMAVAGTHGKTTTSAILGHIMKESNVNATSFLGGIAENYNSNLIAGGSDVSIVEADEYDRSFLELSPNMACITSMDADHLDIYGNHEDLIASFKDFSTKVSGEVLVKDGLPIQGLSFGIDSKTDYSAGNIRVEGGGYVFDVQTPTEKFENIRIKLPGKHNVLNTVAALAMANMYGVSLPTIAKALLSFKGIKRRFSYVIDDENFVLIDDYAHHPKEIDAVSDTMRTLYPDETILAVFQPHLFSRTQDFADDFAKSLSAFDQLILLDIYPAREIPINGVTSRWLLEKIPLKNKMISSKNDLVANIKKMESKIVVIIGAGDIGEEVEKIKLRLR